MTFFVVAVSEVCTQCICCHIILTLHHFLSHVVIVFEPCILFCLVVTSAIELVYSITLVVTCFKLFHFKRIISVHYLQAYKRTLSRQRPITVVAVQRQIG